MAIFYEIVPEFPIPMLPVNTVCRDRELAYRLAEDESEFTGIPHTVEERHLEVAL